jgi:hypothetical protein
MPLLGSDDRRHAKAVQKSDRIVLKLAKISCASDEEFFTKLAHIAEVEFKDYGDPEGQNYEGMLIAVRSYLAQRKKNAQDTYARLVLQGYFRPGACERALEILRPGLANLLASEPSLAVEAMLSLGSKGCLGHAATRVAPGHRLYQSCLTVNRTVCE